MNILVQFPSIVEKYSAYFEKCFSAEDYEHFKKAVSGFLLSENKTISGINRLFAFNQRDQSSLNRFFHRSEEVLEQVNTARLSMLQGNAGTRFKPGRTGGGVLSIDNSLLKHHGKHFDNIYYHYDYVYKCYRWCHDLVSLYYSDDQTDYPVNWILWTPPDWEAVAQYFMKQDYHINTDKWENRHTQPQKWRNYIRDRYRKGRQKHPEVVQIYKTKLHLAADLLRKFVQQYPQYSGQQRMPVALDTGFTSPELCDIIRVELDMDYVASLREDQKVVDKENGQLIPLSTLVERLRAQHLAQQADPNQSNLVQKTAFTFRGEKIEVYAYCLNYRVSKYEQKQRLVISFLKSDLSDRPNLTISNRLDWNASGILRIRRHRWGVETYHQEGKAEGLEQYQARGYKAVQTHIALIVVAFSMLKLLSHDQNLLSKIQQRLQTDTSSTLPFFRRLFRAEGLVNLMEYVFTAVKTGKSFNQIYQPFVKLIASTGVA